MPLLYIESEEKSSSIGKFSYADVLTLEEVGFGFFLT